MVKKAVKKAAKKKSQIIITFTKQMKGMGVEIKGNHISLKMLSMTHEALGEAIMSEVSKG